MKRILLLSRQTAKDTIRMFFTLIPHEIEFSLILHQMDLALNQENPNFDRELPKNHPKRLPGSTARKPLACTRSNS